MRIATFVVLSGLLIFSAGCASRGNPDQIASLQGQLTQTEAALRAQEERNKALEAELQAAQGGNAGIPQEPYKGAIYRTPSGFEIAAIEVQRALKSAGYYSGTVDGKIGPDSREAIRNFQRDNSIAPDGVCGRQTWNKLKTHLASN